MLPVTQFLNPFSSKLRAVALSVMLFFASQQTALADRVAQSTQMIDALVAESLMLVDNESLDQTAREAEVARLLDRYFNFDAITKASTGQYWRAANADEKSRYAMLFKNVLVRSLAGQLDQLKGLSYKTNGHTAKGPKMLLVNGLVSDPSGKQADIIMSWRVATLPDKPVQVIDVQIENISMLKTQQQENKAIIRKGGGKFSALIAALEEQAAALD